MATKPFAFVSTARPAQMPTASLRTYAPSGCPMDRHAGRRPASAHRFKPADNAEALPASSAASKHLTNSKGCLQGGILGSISDLASHSTASKHARHACARHNLYPALSLLWPSILQRPNLATQPRLRTASSVHGATFQAPVRPATAARRLNTARHLTPDCF